MVLIYSTAVTNRLQYACSFIFTEQVPLGFEITSDREKFTQYGGVKINYSPAAICSDEFWIENTRLLFESNIMQQAVSCFEVNGYKAFFKTLASAYPFDLFAATFYLISRYEEYLPHKKDMYGRYAHENSLAYREGFLQLPLVNIWLNDFVLALQKKFPGCHPTAPGFSFVPTYDIDIAYAFKHKGLWRSMGALLKSPSAERVKVLLGTRQDPFDAYDWMDALHEKHRLQPIYFFLAASQNAQYDKNILPHKTAFGSLAKRHAARYPIGIHPSWQSGDDVLLLEKEKAILEHLIGDTVKKSRQHYIRFHLPQGYRQLLQAAITDDYSMGYGSINGFRASVAASFYWYDLEKEEPTALRIHPFCFMDANSFYEQHFSAAEAYEEAMHYLAVCKKTGGSLCTIWHNNFLGTANAFAGWRECYQQFISQAQP